MFIKSFLQDLKGNGPINGFLADQSTRLNWTPTRNQRHEHFVQLSRLIEDAKSPGFWGTLFVSLSAKNKSKQPFIVSVDWLGRRFILFVHNTSTECQKYDICKALSRDVIYSNDYQTWFEYQISFYLSCFYVLTIRFTLMWEMHFETR